MKRKLALLVLFTFLFSGVSFAAMRFGDGTTNITAGGTAQVLTATSTDVTSVTICADTGTVGKVTIGDSPVSTANSQEGIVIVAGQCATISVDSGTFNISTIKVNSGTTNDDISWFWTCERC